ncbi:hypothetical protein F0L68_10625 [Solihabitans fulvus]|uniref:Uncharacterized protein n=1 Tax=Solihabitans fulvus TaxID=1892852 RepID=A0A5B2XKG6_9PSEU|nr:hypothetical protein [Solihabitans fulvus]KAA2263262.1 hypothetical protein F0L68_10625 [Solihabitans fulvus]
MRAIGRIRWVTLGVIGALAALTGVAAAPASGATAPPRVDLRVLVVSDGTPWVDAISQQLTSEGVPITVIQAGQPGRPAITDGFLADQLNGTPWAKFQGVVLPNQAPAGVTAAELASLAAYEQRFGIRQVDAFTYSSPAVGLNTPIFAGTLDGVTAKLTTAATADAFRYLRGPVAFEDNDPKIAESYGYLATPLPDDPTTGAHFEPYLTATVPGTNTQGTLAGVYRQGGREQLVLGFGYNNFQQQYRLLSHGVVTWLTKGVHLGYYRNYFSVHIDDVFSEDSRWSDVGKCTPGEGDCAPGVPATTPVRMNSADVVNAMLWQATHNYQLDLLFNAAGSDEAVAQNGYDPLTGTLLALHGSFRWVNHTYSHAFLGCVQDFTVIPWRCATDPATGQTLYVDQQTISDEISKNVAWAGAHGLPIRSDELVGGEHSGTFILPQQPNDNPNFLAALAQNGIGWLGLDASREKTQRAVGPALGVPRHPINVFYNVANPAEEVSEYNWIYTSRANGGSGICEDHPDTTTCITPLDPRTGFASYIVPKQTQITMGFVLANDPRPHYMHQTNLAEGRLAYPVLDAVLSSYRSMFAANTPVTNPRLADSGLALERQDAWRAAVNAGTVSGYVQGGAVTIQAPAGIEVPVTVPEGTKVGGAAFGQQYAGERSAYQRVDAAHPTVALALPSAPYAPQAAPAPAARRS